MPRNDQKEVLTKISILCMKNGVLLYRDYIDKIRYHRQLILEGGKNEKLLKVKNYL